MWDVVYETVTFLAALLILLAVIFGVVMEFLGGRQEKRNAEVIEQAARWMDELDQ